MHGRRLRPSLLRGRRPVPVGGDRPRGLLVVSGVRLALVLGFALGGGGVARAQATPTPDERGATQAPHFTPPALKTRVSAEYPKEALDAGIEGTVILEFTVDEKGEVGEVQVKTPAGHGFDEAAV